MHDLSPKMINAFKNHGVRQTSRNGEVIRLPGITSVTLTNPDERVCFFESRDANPFFHLIEAMAMLVPVNSNQLLSFFASNMSSFSDDGKTYNAFYGTRARSHWGDQISKTIEILKHDPHSRQAVVNLWDVNDLTKATKDKACNLCMIFSVDGDHLDMTTFNRSNDCVWGFMTGANMVHFPFFQEYVACSLGLKIGKWHHASANMHVYSWNDKYGKLVEELQSLGQFEYVGYAGIAQPLFDAPGNRRIFDIELRSVLEEIDFAVRDFDNGLPPRFARTQLRLSGFVRTVLAPMFNIFLAYKLARKQKHSASEIRMALEEHFDCMLPNNDWRLAASQWINRRLKPTH